VRERVAEGALQVKFISSSDQLADVFTKTKHTADVRLIQVQYKPSMYNSVD
jgi:hypothetical protein